MQMTQTKPQTLLATMALALVGSSAHAVEYSSEDFEAGTVNYSINGVNNGTESDSWFPLTTPQLADDGTDYVFGASSRNGIVANGDPTDIGGGTNEPTGKHAVIAGTANRNMTSNYAMTLASDGAQSLDISFSYMFYALENQTAKGTAILTYSATGFIDLDPVANGVQTDAVQLASFGFGQAGSTVVTPDYVTPSEESWHSLDLSFTEAGAGITFTDTAKIRINRVAMVGLVSPDTNLNYITFLDDITVSSTVPEPSSLALLGLGGLLLARRRRNS